MISNAVPGRWYRATLSVNDYAGFTATVCERDTAGVCGTWSRATPANKLWRFDSTSYVGMADLDNATKHDDAPIGHRCAIKDHLVLSAFM